VSGDVNGDVNGDEPLSSRVFRKDSPPLGRGERSLSYMTSSTCRKLAVPTTSGDRVCLRGRRAHAAHRRSFHLDETVSSVVSM